ncbi:phosphatidylinositol N-acetylglucosaminyltransferase subunit Q-like [Amphiura filiformis]|uniref:phosphatidylinositol N-acetylglucosaminyltransferase subunit Q-like n=1 Tax=Amphiura filiformis TaxID=82378 RepID=UPI003B21CE22
MNEQQHNIWKVFFPQNSLRSPSGICLGWVCPRRQLVCIIGIAHATSREISHHLSRLKDSDETKLEIVGVWVNEAPDLDSHDSDAKRTIREQCSVSCRNNELILHQQQYDGIPICKLSMKENATKSSVQTLFILYDEKQVLGSKLNQWGMHLSSTNKLPTHNTEISATTQERTDIEEVFHLVQRSVPELRRLKSKLKRSMSGDILSDGGWHWTKAFRSVLWQLCCFQLSVLFAVLHLLFDHRLFQNRAMWWLVRFPATGCQLIERCKSLKSLLRDDWNMASKATSEMEETQMTHEKKHCTNERRGNILLCIAVDVILGVLLMVWLQHNHLPVTMADWIMTWANTTGEQLQTLLKWLMGNPAGLKLNSAFAHFLGHFFLYHVYLWLGYLTVIRPFLSMLIWCMALSGCLGLSVLFAVASDMLAILTFHIYCFYVYAAKIYNLQMSSLLSLSRLFRGKKWNVLRRRVDSCSYDIDQLFIGTLLFTMLLFLLPTTALFYTVFTMLRFVLLVIQSLLTKLVHLLNTLPVYSLILWVMKSDTLTDGVEFHVKTQLDDKSPYLIMKVQMMSLSRVVQVGRESFYADYRSQDKLTTPKKTIIDLGRRLLRGNLIYPWGE